MVMILMLALKMVEPYASTVNFVGGEEETPPLMSNTWRKKAQNDVVFEMKSWQQTSYSYFIYWTNILNHTCASWMLKF